MAKDENAYSSLDFIFKTPRKLSFTKLYRYYFDYMLRLLYRVILIKGIPKTCGFICVVHMMLEATKRAAIPRPMTTFLMDE